MACFRYTKIIVNTPDVVDTGDCEECPPVNTEFFFILMATDEVTAGAYRFMVDGANQIMIDANY